MTEKVLMRSPTGAVEEVDATPEVLVPLMVRGWQQFMGKEEVTPDVGDSD